MKYTAQPHNTAFLLNIVNFIEHYPQQPVTETFLDFSLLQLKLNGLECETYGEVLQILQLISELGAFYMYRKNNELFIT